MLCMASWLPWIYMCGIFKKEVNNWAILVIPGERDLRARARAGSVQTFHHIVFGIV